MNQISNWIRNESLGVADRLVQINQDHILKDTISGFGMKERVIKMIQILKTVLFPTLYQKGGDDENLNVQVMSLVNEGALSMHSILKDVFISQCEKEQKTHCDRKECVSCADKITIQFMRELPQIREILSTDLIAAYEGDPATRSMEEILLSYPSIEAVCIYRMAHLLFQYGVPLVPRMMTEYAHANTGIDIHPGAIIGDHFFIDHGTGVVIGETCVIGNHVKLYQGVTLGAKSFELDAKGNPVKGVKRHPNIEDHVVIYAGATILGGDVTVGHDSVIGGNVWLVSSLPPYSKVYNATPDLKIKSTC